MKYSASQLEQNKRRFDIGSGLSLEPLSQNILKFIFNSLVEKKILGAFSSNRFNKGKSVFWRKDHGVGVKGDTNELIFLAASSSDKNSIMKIMEKNQVNKALGVLSEKVFKSDNEDIQKAIDELDEISYSEKIKIINNVISKISPFIKICSVSSYTSEKIDQFIEDHCKEVVPGSGVPRKKVVAFYTKGTQQGKIIGTSYFTGVGRANLPEGHPMLVDRETLEAFNEDQSEPFSLAKKFMNSYRNGGQRQ